jgi:hypothetical protein
VSQDNWVFETAPAGEPAPPPTRRRRIVGATGAFLLSGVVLAFGIGVLAVGTQHWLKSASTDCGIGAAADLRVLDSEVLAKVPSIPPADIRRITGCDVGDAGYPSVGWSTESGSAQALQTFADAGWASRPAGTDGDLRFSTKVGNRELIVTAKRTQNAGFNPSGTDVLGRFR